ncbi:hypothetical protein AAC387_Pa12g0659 [Persea americana]
MGEPPSDTNPFFNVFREDSIFQEAYKWLPPVFFSAEYSDPGDCGVIVNAVCNYLSCPKVWHQSPFSNKNFTVAAFMYLHSSRDAGQGFSLGIQISCYVRDRYV